MKDYLIRRLKEELKPALGCTEPIAIALAAANSAKHIKGELSAIELELSGNILKNAMGVGIPGAGMTGIDIAAILGAISGNPEKGLEVLEDITSDDVEKGKLIKENDIVTVKVSERPEKLYIRARIYNQEDKWVETEIIDIHDRIVSIKSENEVFFEKVKEEEKIELESDEKEITVKTIYDFAMDVDIDKVRFILDAVKLNSILSEEGLKGEWGLQVGKSIKKSIEKGILQEDYKNFSLMNTAAAADARMDGSKLAAMSNSGSGNQGITATMPVYSVWLKAKKSEEKLIRALLLSNLIPIHMKKSLGRLSALCGATIAGVGASAGIVYLLGGDYDQMIKAMKNQIAGITGLFCDGAKTSCALKVASSVDCAFDAAIVALNDFGVRGFEGFNDDDIEKTIKNMARLGNEGMAKTDHMMLDIMIEKAKR